MSEYITASRLSTFRECAKKHDLKYREGFRPVIDAEALRFGSLMHKGLEAWWKAQDGRLTAALAAVEGEKDTIDRIKAQELLRGYDTRWWGEEFDEVIAVEAKFDAPLLNPETWRASRTYRLAGKVDVLVRRRGRVLVVEHKTTAQSIDSDADHYWARLALDHQLSLYVLGAESLGHKVDECLYDVIRKPAIRLKSATPEADRKYKKDGSLYAAQRDTDETPDEYRERLRADIEASPEKYFQRRDVPRMNSEIEMFMLDAWQTAQNIHEQAIVGRAPRNPDSCWKFGSPCDFWEVCSAGVNPHESPSFRRLENVHPELEEEETHESVV